MQMAWVARMQQKAAQIGWNHFFFASEMFSPYEIKKFLADFSIALNVNRMKMKWECNASGIKRMKGVEKGESMQSC